jgi:hypothetical protein
MKQGFTTGVFLSGFLLFNMCSAQIISKNSYEVISLESSFVKHGLNLLISIPDEGRNKDLPAVIFLPFIKEDSSVKLAIENCKQLMPAAIIVGIQNFGIPEKPGIKPVAFVNGFASEGSDTNFDAYYKAVKDEILPMIREKYNGVERWILGSINTDKFTAYVLSNDPGGFYSYFSMQPFLLFNSKRETVLAKDYFLNYSAYKRLDLSNLSIEEINWPDQMLVKLGVKLPIYFQE